MELEPICGLDGSRAIWRLIRSNGREVSKVGILPGIARLDEQRSDARVLRESLDPPSRGLRTIVTPETNGKRRIIGQSPNMAHGQTQKEL